MSLGISFAAMGFLFRLWTASYERDPHVFFRRGPYRHVRHPYLLGSFLLGFGLMVATKSAWLVMVYLIASSLLMRLKVIQAELELHQRFGRVYANYCRQVSAFFPQILPCPASREDRLVSFQFFQFRSEHYSEFLSILACVIVFVLFRFSMEWNIWHRLVICFILVTVYTLSSRRYRIAL